MARLYCSNCKKEFYGGICPACGALGIRPVKHQSPAVGCLVLVVFCIVIFLVVHFGCSSSTPPPSQRAKPAVIHKLRPDQWELVTNMESKGWIEIDAPRHRVFVDTALWLGMNAKLKEDFTCTMADACAERSQSGIENVTLIDKQSARNLATWKVDMWGSPQFTVY